MFATQLVFFLFNSFCFVWLFCAWSFRKSICRFCTCSNEIVESDQNFEETYIWTRHGSICLNYESETVEHKLFPSQPLCYWFIFLYKFCISLGKFRTCSFQHQFLKQLEYWQGTSQEENTCWVSSNWNTQNTSNCISVKLKVDSFFEEVPIGPKVHEMRTVGCLLTAFVVSCIGIDNTALICCLPFKNWCFKKVRSVIFLTGDLNTG